MLQFANLQNPTLAYASGIRIPSSLQLARPKAYGCQTPARPNQVYTCIRQIFLHIFKHSKICVQDEFILIRQQFQSEAVGHQSIAIAIVSITNLNIHVGSSMRHMCNDSYMCNDSHIFIWSSHYIAGFQWSYAQHMTSLKTALSIYVQRNTLHQGCPQAGHMQVNGEQAKLKHPMSKRRISKQDLLCKTET